jgi:hypothetical protein
MQDPAPSFRTLSQGGDGGGRSVFLQTQMRLRENEFVENHELVLFVGTWNVNGKVPKEALAPWLLPSDMPTPDVVALGLQEFDTSSAALILAETSKVEPWIAAMGATLNRLPEVQVLVPVLSFFFAQLLNSTLCLRSSSSEASSKPSGFARRSCHS